jgi:hypothetical protein
MVKPEPHAFISYVKEDSELVDVLEEALSVLGIRVWRDKNDLAPGLPWKDSIRAAIQQNTLAFIPCFSPASEARDTTYQREEVILAAEEYRLRHPARPWLFPVRLGEVGLPPYELGPNRDLNSLQRTDLFGPRQGVNLARLAQSVLSLLGTATDAAPTKKVLTPVASRLGRVRELLRDPQGDIELEDFLHTAMTETVRSLQAIRGVADDASGADLVRQAVLAIPAYDAALKEALEIFVLCGLYGQDQHQAALSNAAALIASAKPERSGKSINLSMNRYPALLVLQAVAVAAAARHNYGALRSVALDAQTWVLNGRIPLAGYVSQASVLGPNGWMGTLLRRLDQDPPEVISDELIERAYSRRISLHHTPIADHMHEILRPLFARTIADDHDYDDAFLKAEMLLDSMATDLRLRAANYQEPTVSPGQGRYTWNDPYARKSPMVAFADAAKADGDQWPPLRAGLFGGEIGRMDKAVSLLTDNAEHARQVREV